MERTNGQCREIYGSNSEHSELTLLLRNKFLLTLTQRSRYETAVQEVISSPTSGIAAATDRHKEIIEQKFTAMQSALDFKLQALDEKAAHGDVATVELVIEACFCSYFCLLQQ